MRSFAQTTSSHTVIAHVAQCKEVPDEIRNPIMRLQQEERFLPDSGLYGTRKKFYDLVWSRLHGKEDVKEEADEEEAAEEEAEDKKRKASSPPAAAKAQPEKKAKPEDAQNVSVEEAAAAQSEKKAKVEEMQAVTTAQV